jgi:hypothetical protein
MLGSLAAIDAAFRKHAMGAEPVAEDVDSPEERPTMSWRKDEIVAWLEASEATFSPSDSKAELLERVEQV